MTIKTRNPPGRCREGRWSAIEFQINAIASQPSWVASSGGSC